MENPPPPQKGSTWQKELLWIGLGIFILTILSLCGPSFFPVVVVPTSGRLPCTFKHTTSFANSLTDQESKILTVSLYGENEDCTTDVRFDITNFVISPSENVQKASILFHQTTQVIWVLHPESQGKFSYAVSFPGSQTLGIDESTITVTNDIGFPSWITSVLAPLAALIFGPLLTVPYWIDKCSTWIKKGKGKGKQKTQVRKTRIRAKKR